MVSQPDPVSDSEVDASSASAPPSPVSEKKRAANRENAKRSTGPRTAKGKARSRLNATRHGLRAELPPERGFVIGVANDEDPDAYRRLRRALRADLRPKGAAEQFLVERLARTAWRLRRGEAVEVHLLDAAEARRFEAHERCRAIAARSPGRLTPETEAEAAEPYRFRTLPELEAAQFTPAAAGRDGSEAPFLRLAAYQARLEGQFRATLRELRALRKDRATWAEQEDDRDDDDDHDCNGVGTDEGKPLAASRTRVPPPTNEPTDAREVATATGATDDGADDRAARSSAEPQAAVAPTNEPAALGIDANAEPCAGTRVVSSKVVRDGDAPDSHPTRVDACRDAEGGSPHVAVTSPTNGPTVTRF